MNVYTVTAAFKAVPVGIPLEVGDVVYRYAGETKVVFALSPSPVPDPSTIFIGGTEWSSDSFWNWSDSVDGATFLSHTGTIGDPPSGVAQDMGTADLVSGQDYVAVTFGSVLSSVPTSICVSVAKPLSSDRNIFATIREDSITVSGFTADLSGSPDKAGYKLNYSSF